MRTLLPGRKALLVGCAMISLLLSATQAVETSIERLQLATPLTVFEGWGTSLCWFANEIGRWPEADKAAIADAIFSVRGLGFTIARYNIGGGENPAHHHMVAFRQMEGFQPKP